MDAENIVKLTPAAIRDLLEAQHVPTHAKQTPGKRRAERWPFAGTVEVWLPESCYGEQHVLATLHNLSQGGFAMRTRRPIPTETRVQMAIHQPLQSVYGHAIVRHCTRAAVGYLVGAEFIFMADDHTPPKPQ